MEKINLRVSKAQLEELLDALQYTSASSTHSGRKAASERNWSWLAHRYTMAWGLPPAAAAALKEIEGA